MNNKIKLLAVDMDGTCLDSKSRMSEETVKALKTAADKGILIVPTTGRNLACLPHRLKKESFYRYAIVSNGAKVIDLKENGRIFDSCIAGKTAVELLEKCKNQGFGITAQIENDYYLQGVLLSLAGRIYYGKDAANSHRVSCIADMVRKNNCHVEEIQLYLLHPKARKRIEEILKQFTNLSAAYSSLYVEIFDQNASKGKALAALAKHLGIDSSEIACIGDGENDLTMFDVSGMRFAMGNAVPELKEKADFILPTNNENGVVKAVKRII